MKQLALDMSTQLWTCLTTLWPTCPVRSLRMAHAHGVKRHFPLASHTALSLHRVPQRRSRPFHCYRLNKTSGSYVPSLPPSFFSPVEQEQLHPCSLMLSPRAAPADQLRPARGKKPLLSMILYIFPTSVEADYFFTGSSSSLGKQVQTRSPSSASSLNF
jgi:hypothetical protein